MALIIPGLRYDSTLCIILVICSFPASWIKGDKYPNGIPYNTKLSKLDKKLIKKFYGKPRSSNTKADLETPVDSTK